MTAVTNNREEEVRTKPRRFWWAKGHPPEWQLSDKRTITVGHRNGFFL